MTRSPSIFRASTATPALRAKPSAAFVHLPSCSACFAGGPDSLLRTSGAFSAMAVTIIASLRGVAKVAMLARCPSPSPFRRASSSALLISAAIHSRAGFWKLAGSSSVPISKTRSISPALRPARLRGLLRRLVGEEVGVAGQLLLGEGPVLERRELHLRPRRQIEPRAVVGEPADAEDEALPLGDADGAARVEQVEGVRALQAVVVRGQGQLLFDETAALLLVLVEEAEEAVGIAGVEAVLALLPLVLPEHVPVREARSIGIGAEHQIVDVIDALQVHRDALEAVGQLGGDGPALEPAGLLEIGELRHLHPVAPHFPAQAPGAQRRRLPVVLDEAQVVVAGGDADGAQRPEVLLLHILGARLQDHLVLVVLVEAIGILAEPSVGGAPGRLDVGHVPGLRTEHAQERGGIHRARAHFQVVSLHQRAAALGPVRLQREEELLEVLGSTGHRAPERRRSAAIAQAQLWENVAGFGMMGTGWRSFIICTATSNSRRAAPFGAAAAGALGPGGPMTADLRQAKASLLRLRFPSLVQLRAHLHIEDNATLLFFRDSP